MKYEVVSDEAWETSYRVASSLSKELYVQELLAGKIIKIGEADYNKLGSLYRLARDAGKSLKVRSVDGAKLLRMVAAETQAGEPAKE